jgi:VanZ family protein
MAGHRHHRSRHRGDSPPRRRPESIALLAFAILLIALLTLGPGETDEQTRICLVCTGQTADALMNLLLFVPLGVALAMLGIGPRRTVAIAAAASIGIEFIQLFALEGRFAAPADVLANAVGAAVGFALAVRRERFLYPRSDQALRFAIAGAGMWLLALLVTAVGLRHSFPGGGYVGQWAPELNGQRRFSGRVTSMSINDIPVGDGAVHDSAALRDATRSGVTVVVMTTAGQPARVAAPIVRLVDGRERGLVYLARRRSDLVVRTRVLASAVGLHSPTLVVGGAFLEWDRAAPVPVPITAERRSDLLRASVGGETATLPIHPALGWMLLLPFDADLVERQIPVSAAWIALPLVAVGYWIGRRARRRARRSGRERGWASTSGELTMTAPPVALLLAVGLGGVAMAFGQRLPPGEVWVGAVIGLGVGMAVGVRFALRHTEHGHRRERGGEQVTAPGTATSMS